MKECFIPNHSVSFLCGMCSRLDKQEALFAKFDLRQSDAYSTYYLGISGVREWIECIKWNALHMLFAESKSRSHTHTRTDVRWYSIFDMCGMINFVRDVIWICQDRINTQIPIVLFKHHISNFGASRLLHSRKQCLLIIQAWTHTTQNDSV